MSSVPELQGLGGQTLNKCGSTTNEGEKKVKKNFISLQENGCRENAELHQEDQARQAENKERG